MIDMTLINGPIMSVFAEPITLDGNAIDAIVDLRSGGRDIGGGMLIDKVDPSITVNTVSLSGLMLGKNSVAVIRSSEYRIGNIGQDDNGLTVITLRPV